MAPTAAPVIKPPAAPGAPGLAIPAAPKAATPAPGMTKVAPVGSQPRKETVQIKALKPLGPTRPAGVAPSKPASGALAPSPAKPASGTLPTAPAAGSSAPTTVVKSPTPPANKGAAAFTPAPAKMASQTVVVEGGADVLSLSLAGVAALASWLTAGYLMYSYFTV